MTQITIAVDGIKQLDRNMRLLVKGVQDTKEMNKQVIKLVDENIDEVFKQEGKNVEKGKRWKPLSEATLIAREQGRGYYSRPSNNPGVLRRTGNLQDKRKITVTKNFGQLQMLMPYAKYHHRGGKKKNRPPERTIIDINNRLAADIVRAVQKVIYKHTRIIQI